MGEKEQTNNTGKILSHAEGKADTNNGRADLCIHKKPDVNINKQGLPYMGIHPARSCDILHAVFEVIAMALRAEERGILSLVPRFVFAMHYGSTLRT